VCIYIYTHTYVRTYIHTYISNEDGEEGDDDEGDKNFEKGDICVCVYIYIHTYVHTYIHTFQMKMGKRAMTMKVTRTLKRAIELKHAGKAARNTTPGSWLRITKMVLAMLRYHSRL
jgi:hypothetical protein